MDVSEAPDLVSPPAAGSESGRSDSPRAAERVHVTLAGLGDQATDEDRLGFAPYVDAVAAFVSSDSTQPPLTLSVEGPWGSGKSSFLQQVRKVLQGQSCPTVWFSPWRHEKSENLWASFALTVLDQLRDQQPWIRRQIAAIRLFGFRYRTTPAGGLALVQRIAGVFAVASLVVLLALPATRATILEYLPGLSKGTAGESLVRDITSGFGAFGAAIWALVFGVRRWLEIAGNPLAANLRAYLRTPDYEGKTTFLEEFHHDFRRVLSAFVGPGRLYVFIDDLDRCHPATAVELMKALSLLLPEDGNLVFLIAIDRDRVAAGLANMADKLAPPVGADPSRFGHEFLEKFIQVPFRLPSPRESSLEGLFGVPPDSDGRELTTGTPEPERVKRRRDLEIAVGRDSPALVELTRTLAPSLDNNPRRLKQFFNLLRLHAYLGHQSGLFDTVGGRRGVHLEQLAKILVLYLRWPRALTELLLGGLRLNVMENASFDWQVSTTNETEQKWLPVLRLLLRAGLSDPGATEGDLAATMRAMSEWSLTGLDLELITRVAPRLPTVAWPETPVQPERSTPRGHDQDRRAGRTTYPDPDMLSPSDQVRMA